MKGKKELIVKGDQVDLIVDSLVRHGKVKATHLGQFKVIKVKARQSHDVTKGVMVKMKAYKKVKFMATESLKRELNK